MRYKTLLCDCNRTMQIDGKVIARGLNVDELPRVQSEMCRRHLAAFEAAIKSGDDLLVACTQEAPLFTELHAELGGTGAIRFANIRESAGWSDEGRSAAPKMAALLAMADAPDPEPVPTVSYEAGGNLLIVGPGAAALAWAEQVRVPTENAVAIGPIVVQQVEALVAQPGSLKESLLGMSFLSRLRSYEFSGDYLTLRS